MVHELNAALYVLRCMCCAVCAALYVLQVLVARQVKIPETVASWAKRGVEPITKMQFRQNVRGHASHSAALYASSAAPCVRHLLSLSLSLCVCSPYLSIPLHA